MNSTAWLSFAALVAWAAGGCCGGKPVKTAAGEGGVVQGGSASEKDTDGDHIPDSRDKCPAEKEVFNGYADEDGCPDSVDIFPIENIEITARIFFKQGESAIQEVSFQVLDEIAELLKAVPQIKLLRIKGHIDPQEKVAAGPDLSQERAGSVMAYLVSKGIDEGRLEAVGLGDTKPAVDAEGKEGEETAQYNRRVEFEIADMEK
jgi:outer membrane protein OmpA-like peptidoglycan-associated protein